MNITVFGATGVVGRALVPLLAEHELTAVSRTARAEPGVRWVVADAASGDGVAAALAGAEVVYYLVHSLGTHDFEEQDRKAAQTVAYAAATAGVRQIVYLGGLGADEPDASPHLRSRRETGERLAAAGVPVTTLRAAMIIGKGSAAWAGPLVSPVRPAEPGLAPPDAGLAGGARSRRSCRLGSGCRG